jgi:hemerythrin-like metal-binding protein
MSYIEWDDEEFSVGIEQFDSQHQRLFGALNDLHSAMKEGKGREEIGTILDELESYTETHFSDEEDFMQDCSYSSHCQTCFRSHQSAHEEFAEEVASFRQRYDDGEVMLTMDVIDFLKDWLTSHIAGSELDQDYGQYYDEAA